MPRLESNHGQAEILYCLLHPRFRHVDFLACVLHSDLQDGSGAEEQFIIQAGEKRLHLPGQLRPGYRHEKDLRVEKDPHS
jgi:hypothetical protein